MDEEHLLDNQLLSRPSMVEHIKSLIDQNSNQALKLSSLAAFERHAKVTHRDLESQLARKELEIKSLNANETSLQKEIQDLQKEIQNSQSLTTDTCALHEELSKEITSLQEQIALLELEKEYMKPAPTPREPQLTEQIQVLEGKYLAAVEECKVSEEEGLNVITQLEEELSQTREKVKALVQQKEWHPKIPISPPETEVPLPTPTYIPV